MQLVEFRDGADHVAGAALFLWDCAWPWRVLRSSRYDCEARANRSLARIFRLEFRQFRQQIAHALVHGLGHDHLQFDVQIAAMAGLPHRRHALFAQAQLLSAVGSRRDAQQRAAIERGHFDLGAQRRFGDVMGTTV